MNGVSAFEPAGRRDERVQAAEPSLRILQGGLDDLSVGEIDPVDRQRPRAQVVFPADRRPVEKNTGGSGGIEAGGDRPAEVAGGARHHDDTVR